MDFQEIIYLSSLFAHKIPDEVAYFTLLTIGVSAPMFVPTVRILLLRYGKLKNDNQVSFVEENIYLRMFNTKLPCLNLKRFNFYFLPPTKSVLRLPVRFSYGTTHIKIQLLDKWFFGPYYNFIYTYILPIHKFANTINKYLTHTNNKLLKFALEQLLVLDYARKGILIPISDISLEKRGRSCYVVNIQNSKAKIHISEQIHNMLKNYIKVY